MNAKQLARRGLPKDFSLSPSEKHPQYGQYV
jgi:hypothetical protein